MHRIGENRVLLSMLNLASPKQAGGGEKSGAGRDNKPFMAACTAAAAARAYAFGGAGQRVSVSAKDLSALVGAVWRAWDEDDGGITVPRATVRAWRKNQALMEVALAAVLNSPPVPCLHGGHIFDAGGGAVYRVRRARRTGDCFIDHREGGKWRWRRGDALNTLGEMLGKGGNFKAVLSFIGIVEAELEKRDLFAVSPWARVASRTGLLKLQAGHSGLQENTRLLLAVVWLAANGKGFDVTDPRDRARAAAAAKIGGEGARRRFLRLAAVLPAGTLKFAPMDWGEFAAWSGQLLDSAKERKSVVQFRVCLSLWRACLSKDGGEWRWRGFHDTFRQQRGRGGLAHKVASAVGCSKNAAAAAMSTLMMLGFLAKSGMAICLMAGWWGRTIAARILFIIRAPLPKTLRRLAGRLAGIFCPVPPPSPHPTQ